VLLLPQMMSNHHHVVFFDPEGTAVEFYQHLHTQLAKCMNALRGRWENLWSVDEPCLVELISAEDVMNKLVYTATNPVKDGLVERVHHWPGPPTVAALLGGRVLRARRPDHYYRDVGPMPEDVELRLELPPLLDADAISELRTRIGEVEASCAAQRLHDQRLVLGRRRILRQSWRDQPASVEPRRNLRPRVAAENRDQRLAALTRNRQFQADYAAARSLWLQGVQVGTYWLRRFARVVIAAADPGPALHSTFA
jgi:putative transposase